MRYIGYFVLLLVGVSCQSSDLAEVTAWPGLTASLDSLFQPTHPRVFSGVIHVQQGQEVLYTRGEGIGMGAERQPLTAAQPFVIGSLSKQITAALVLRESQRENLELDWRIGAYLPRLTESWKDTVTVRQLLNHTHGITGLESPLSYPPGTAFAYSNLGYQLLGNILAATTDTPYPELAADLFMALGMEQAVASPELSAGLLPGFYRFQSEQADQLLPDSTTFSGQYLPAALLIASAKDLAIWNEALHEGGLLEEGVYQQMINPEVRQDHSLFGDVGYGYGVRISTQDSLVEIGHTGYVPGYVSMNLYYPAKELSVIVLENLDWRAENITETFSFELGVRELVREALLN